jgi:hypothetical protein
MARNPIYTTKGNWAGLLVDGFFYDLRGEWVGWIGKDGQVFSVTGKYIGWLAKDFRILRKKVLDGPAPQRQPPTPPAYKVPMPPNAPLPPMMAELPFDTFDVMDEEPERLHTSADDPDAKDMD